MIRLYNSLTKQKENFRSLGEEKNLPTGRQVQNKKVTMYNCGPTVYDYVHIGNLRSFLVVDLLRRYLEFSGYKVKQVMNITDVGHMTSDAEAGEDKLEVAARKEKKSPWEIAEFFTKAFFSDIAKINIQKVWKYPKATDHIKEMIKIIEKLLKNGFAYKVNGSVYFDLSKFPAYGKLSGNTVQDLLAGARVEVVSEKKNPYDFALWIENPKHVMQWKAPWSIVAGYPGWHLECSAMSMKYLGETIDIHTGGEDNKFPHHECEIAQSEGATGKQFARYWLHVRHLLVNGEKMSKSKGNFYTLSQVLDKGYSPRAVRYLLLSTHYRDPLNFTFEGLKAAETALQRFDETWTKLCEAKGGKNGNGLVSAAEKARADFGAALDEDLNISGALAAVFNFIRKINAAIANGASKKELTAAKELLKEFDGVLGFGLEKIKAEKIPAEIKNLLERREQARKNKDWTKADEVRGEIEKLGYTVEDTTEGQRVKTRVL
jgi:cysteinyl-tRNA synthetase